MNKQGYCTACGRDDTPTKVFETIEAELCGLCARIPYTKHFSPSERLVLAVGSVILDELKKLNRTKQNKPAARRSRR